MNTSSLRSRLLSLAIHGQLVPQDPNDEPASALLARIQAEKANAEKGKKRSAKPSLSVEDAPFELPEGWCWTTVENISKSILYGVSESAKVSGKYKLLRITDIQDNKVNWNTVPYTDYDEKKVRSYLLKKGDILFARTGATVGKSYLVDEISEESLYASYLIRVQIYDSICAEYIKLFFESDYYWQQIKLNSVGIGQPNVNGTVLSSLLIPLPPLPEQHRITRALTALFAQIDKIDEAKATLRTLVQRAKAKVLDLAIHGKLVPQLPEEENAAEVVKRIQEERNKDPKRKKMASAPIKAEEVPFEVPEGWCWTTLGEIGDVVTGSTPSKDVKEYYNGDIPFFKPTDLEQGIDTKYANDHLSQLGYEVSRQIPANSVLVTCIGATIGKTGMITVDGTCNQQINAIIPSKAVFSVFLYMVCVSNFIQNQIKENASATTLPILNKNNFARILFPLPPLTEQHRIVAKIGEIFRELERIEGSL